MTDKKGAFGRLFLSQIEDKVLISILKTEVIRWVAGQESERNVDATIFEVTNQGEGYYCV